VAFECGAEGGLGAGMGLRMMVTGVGCCTTGQAVMNGQDLCHERRVRHNVLTMPSC